MKTSIWKRNFLYTLIGDGAVNVTISRFNLYIPTTNPSQETQMIFNEVITKSFTKSSESRTTDRKSVTTGKEIQLNINLASNLIFPLYLFAAHQKTQRINPAHPTENLSNKRFNDANFDNFCANKHFEEIDGIRYPKDPSINYYKKNYYPNQYRDLKSLYKKIVAKEILSSIITYDKMKTIYPIQIIELNIKSIMSLQRKLDFLNSIVMFLLILNCLLG